MKFMPTQHILDFSVILTEFYTSSCYLSESYQNASVMNKKENNNEAV